MQIFYESNVFWPSVSWCPIRSHVCPFSVLAQLSLNTYGLSGRTYANTEAWEIRLRTLCFWAPLGLVCMTCSQTVIQTEAVPLIKQQSRGFGFSKPLTCNLIFLQQHHKPCCQCYKQRGNCVSVEIPLFLSRVIQGLFSRENIWVSSVVQQNWHFAAELQREILKGKNLEFDPYTEEMWCLSYTERATLLAWICSTFLFRGSGSPIVTKTKQTNTKKKQKKPNFIWWGWCLLGSEWPYQ